MNKEREKELIEELIEQKCKKNVGYFCRKYRISVDDVLRYHGIAYKIKLQRRKANERNKNRVEP